MKKRYFIYAAIIGSIFFFSCGKYEDGPLVSVMPKKSRVINTWELEKALNGNNELEIGDTLFGNYREYKKDGEVVFVTFDGKEYLGSWEFYDKKKYILTKIFINNSTYVEKGRILKLKLKELWLEVDYSAYTWDLHFKAKGN